MSLMNLQCNNSKRLNGDISEKTPFGVCYAKITPNQAQNYKMVILEPDFYTRAEISAIKNTGTLVLAYITLGEVDRYRWYYPILEEIGFKGINENWDSPFLDLESPLTKSLLLDRVLKEIMIKGVDGVFLDTVDAVAPYTELAYMQPDMVEIIRGIRERYPDITIIQNAGLFLLDKTRSVIDGVLIEDIASGYNFREEQYFIKKDQEFHERVRMVETTADSFEVPFFILDFAETETAIKKLRTRLDTLGFPYFISNIRLDELPENPAPVTNTKTYNR